MTKDNQDDSTNAKTFNCQPSTSSQSVTCDEGSSNNRSNNRNNSITHLPFNISQIASKLKNCGVSEANMGNANDEDIVKMWKQMDEKLEANARQHNLSAFNVKSILHHFIKNPSTLAMFMGIAEDETSSDLPSVKITRSRVKEKRPSNNNAELKLRPVDANLVATRPQSFLDLSYDDEEDDEDYQPSESTVDEAAASEADETSVEGELADFFEEDTFCDTTLTDDVFGIDQDQDRGYELRSRVSNLNDAAIHDELADSNNEIIIAREAEVFSNVDDCYREFLYRLQDADTAHSNNLDIGDDDDTDYNPQDDLEEVIDKDEIITNRFTEIPRREVEGMFRDLLDDEMIQETIPSLLPLASVAATTITKSPVKAVEEKPPRVKRPADFVKTANCPRYDDSCTLLGDSNHVYFRLSEYEQLQVQLEQHVQLLTQGVILCNNDPKLFYVKDKYQTMINELDDKYYEKGCNSFYNIPNLEGCIKTCHDILQIKEVSSNDVKWSNSIVQGFFPRPEACLAMCRSHALLYPELVPIVQPSYGLGFSPYFSPHDDLLLALGLIQFGHVKNSSRSDNSGRYYLITKHVLRSKSTSQIRNHLKNVRVRCDGNVLYKIVVDSEDGYPHLNFPIAFNYKLQGTMADWPEKYKPIWYTNFWNQFEMRGNELIRMLVPVPPQVKRSIPRIEKILLKKPTAEKSARKLLALDVMGAFENEKSPSPTGSFKREVHTPNRCVPLTVPTEGAILVGSPAAGYQLINLADQKMFYVSNPNEAIEISAEMLSNEPAVIKLEDLAAAPAAKDTSVKLKRGRPPNTRIKSVNPKPEAVEEKMANPSTPGRKRQKRLSTQPSSKRIKVFEDSTRVTRSRARLERSISVADTIKSSNSQIVIESDSEPEAPSTDCLPQQASSVVDPETRGEEKKKTNDSEKSVSMQNESTLPDEQPGNTDDSSITEAQPSSSGIDLAESVVPVDNVDERFNESSLLSSADAELEYIPDSALSNDTEYNSYVLPLSCHTERIHMNSCIPKTPVPRTPSDSSPIPSPMLQLSVTKSDICENTIIPRTPRDYGYSQSPSLPKSFLTSIQKELDSKKTSIAVRSLFSQVDSDSSTSSKENYFDKKSIPSYLTSFSNMDCTPSTSEKIDNIASNKVDELEEKEMDDQTEQSNGAEQEQRLAEDIPKRGKKRTREEKNNDGLMGMINDVYRNRQECSLAKKISLDIKQRLSMHKEVYSQVQKIMASSQNQNVKMEQLQELLFIDHLDVLCLLSLLVENESLSAELLTCPLRRSYRAAFDIMMGIESYATHVRLKPSAKNLFKSFSKIGPHFSSDHLYAMLKDMIGNEKPLWSFLKKFSCLLYDENPPPSDYEFLDLTKSDFDEEDADFECISSMEPVIGPAPSKKGNKIQVNGEHLFGLNGNSYVPVILKFKAVEKPKPPTPPPTGKPSSFSKDDDLCILTTYTGLECDEAATLKKLCDSMSHAKEHIKERLSFLLSFI